MTIQRKDMRVSSFERKSDEMIIPTPEPFSYAETLTYLTRSPLECLHQVVNENVYKALEVDGEQFLIEMSETDQNALRIRFLIGSPSVHIKSYINEWLDMDRDLVSFNQMADQDPILSPLIEKHCGLRVIGVPDLFEALCWAVIGQQVNLPFAYTVKKRLVESYGESLEWQSNRYWLFPKPEVIARLTVDDLKGIQLTGRKSEYIIHIARLMCDGQLSKAILQKNPEKELLSIRGIGPWSAHYVLMRCLRDPSAFPIGDAGLQNALKNTLNKEKKPSEEEIRKIFQPWKGWEAYAVFYLWRSLS